MHLDTIFSIPNIVPGLILREIGLDIQMIFAGETGLSGAEGATASETLRQTDRKGMDLWKVTLNRPNWL